MDRLTKADSKYTAFENIKLQQYENTGLAPGEAADLRANNYRLRAQLTEANAAREQAEAALGEAVGVLTYFAFTYLSIPPDMDDEEDVNTFVMAGMARQARRIIQSHAKAGEKWRAMEAVVEAAKEAFNMPDGVKPGYLCPSLLVASEDAADRFIYALDALEGVKTE